MKFFLILILIFTFSFFSFGQKKNKNRANQLFIDGFFYRYMPINIESGCKIKIIDSSNVDVSHIENGIRINPARLKKSQITIESNHVRLNFNMALKDPLLELTLNKLKSGSQFTKDDFLGKCRWECQTVNFDAELRANIIDFSMTFYNNENELTKTKSQGVEFSNEQITLLENLESNRVIVIEMNVMLPYKRFVTLESYVIFLKVN
jgi:hypothetical protein